MMPAVQYYKLRDRIAGDLRRGLVAPTPDAVAASVRSAAKITASAAADFAERFFTDLQRHSEGTSPHRR